MDNKDMEFAKESVIEDLKEIKEAIKEKPEITYNPFSSLPDSSIKKALNYLEEASEELGFFRN